MCFELFRHPYCQPSFDSWAGKIIREGEECNYCVPFYAIPIAVAAAGDTVRSLGALFHCHKWSNYTKKAYLKNLIATISLFIQTPFNLIGNIPRVDRLTLFCRESSNLEHQIKALRSSCSFHHPETRFMEQLDANPEVQKRIMSEKCSPNLSVITALDTEERSVKHALLFSYPHKHPLDSHDYCYLLKACLKEGRYYQHAIRELLVNLYMRNYIQNGSGKLKRPESSIAIDLQDESNNKENVYLVLNEEKDMQDNFILPTSLYEPNNRKSITGMADCCFQFPQNTNDCHISKRSILHFVCSTYATNDIDNVRILLDSGIDPEATNEEGFTPLEYLFKKFRTEKRIYHESIDKKRKNLALEIAKLLISRGAFFYDRDLADPALLKSLNKYTIDRKELALDKGQSNRYFKIFRTSVPRRRPGEYESRLNFWLEHLDELRAENYKVFARYFDAIMQNTNLHSVLSDLIVQYLRPN